MSSSSSAASPATAMAPTNVDFYISYTPLATCCVFHPLNERALAWWLENCERGPQRDGGFIVEARYAPAITESMYEDKMTWHTAEQAQ